jgi:hypothetical protein
MKQKNLKRTFTAALLTLVASAAYGQTEPMTAKISFAFRAVGSDLPAGHYKLAPVSGNAGSMGTMELRNMDTGKTVFFSSKDASTAESKDARPRLVFQCGGEGGCSLASVWSGTGAGLEFATPAFTAAQRERRETVYLDRFKQK